jgi:hypothetical protein
MMFMTSKKTGEQVHLQDQQTLHLEEKGKALVESNTRKWPYKR